MRNKPVFDIADFAIAERWIEKTSDCICLAAEEVIESYRHRWHDPDWGQIWAERLTQSARARSKRASTSK